MMLKLEEQYGRKFKNISTAQETLQIIRNACSCVECFNIKFCTSQSSNDLPFVFLIFKSNLHRSSLRFGVTYQMKNYWPALF